MCRVIAVLSMQRSGTTTLCRDLVSWGILCDFELFNFGATEWMQQRGFKVSQLTNISAEGALAHPGVWIRKAQELQGLNSSRHSSSCAYVFKLFPEHVHWSWEGRTSNVVLPRILQHVNACVIYRRANLTAQYLSKRDAEENGCWATDPSRKARDPRCHSGRPKPDKLGSDWPKFRRTADSWFASASRHCTAGQKPTLQLSTEAYLGDAALRSALGFMFQLWTDGSGVLRHAPQSKHKALIAPLQKPAQAPSTATQSLHFNPSNLSNPWVQSKFFHIPQTLTLAPPSPGKM